MPRRRRRPRDPGVVMPGAMTPDHVEHRQNMLRSSAASPQASKRDLLRRRNGKVGRSWRGEVW